jgi:hypothetical protein
MQEEAINNAKVIFQYITETYLEKPTALAMVPVSKPIALPAIRTPPFLASACAFQWLTAATSSTTIAKCTLQEELANELNCHFRFEATLVEQQEGHLNSEPSAQEVLLNPLIWWKVSHYSIPVSQIPNSVVRSMLPNSQPLPGWPETISPSQQLVLLLSMSSQNPDIYVLTYKAH